jgi:hypothetical protein
MAKAEMYKRRSVALGGLASFIHIYIPHSTSNTTSITYSILSPSKNTNNINMPSFKGTFPTWIRSTDLC